MTRPTPQPALASLPISGSRFVGRETDIAVISTLLRDPSTRLVTIAGPGGIGKTRLAVEVCSRFPERFPDGTVIVPLASTTNTDQVPAIIAHALGLETHEETPTLDTLVAALHDAKMLLVLDNLEHLLAFGPTLAALLRRCPHLTVVATSRARLELLVEHCYTLGPLPLCAARELFQFRARMVSNGPVPTQPCEPTVIDAVCTKVDCIPLAIELAAARTATLPARAILERLPGLDLLRAGPRDAESRHQTMHDTIAWSYDLLNPSHQAGFRRLAIFNGGFTLPGAAAIVGAQDALDLIDLLVARSLVVPIASESGRPRFTMLEPIRQFGRHMLVERGEADDTGVAHADAMIAFVEASIPLITSDRQREQLAMLHDEHDNLRAALQWCLDREDGIRANQLAGGLWRVARLNRESWLEAQSRQARLQEGLHWLERALSIRHDVPSRYLIEPLAGIATLLFMRGAYAAATRYAEELLWRSREIGDLDGEITAHFNLAMLSQHMGDTSRARALLTIALDGATRLNEPDLALANIHLAFGNLERTLGNLTAAETHLREALARIAHHGSPIETGHVIFTLALLCHQLGRPAEAQHLALEGASQIGDLFDAALMHVAAWIFADAALSITKTTIAVQLLACSASAPPLAQWVNLDGARMAPFRAALPEAAFAKAWETGTTLRWSDVRDLANQIAAEIEHRKQVLAIDPSERSLPLSPRELDVLRLVVDGLTNREIGESLFISDRTVEKHLQRIVTRLEIDSRTALVAWAVRHGVVA